jgi:hypothetical protein
MSQFLAFFSNLGRLTKNWSLLLDRPLLAQVNGNVSCLHMWRDIDKGLTETIKVDSSGFCLMLF